MRKLVENTFQTHDTIQQQISVDEAKLKREQLKHYLVMGAFMVVWIAFIIY